ncbi:MAG TPA: DUF5698 domain-containing protein [Myxococcota bacterium]|nr:DUF5698 domain-containing protein [Myxococcota bacterium]
MMWEVAGGAALVFFMRIGDVSLGTIRQIMAVRGRGALAAAIGFVEVTIFILAISRVLASIGENPVYVLAYSGGFATGTLVGVQVERLIGIGTRIIRVITIRQNDELVEALRQAGFGVTQIDAQGKDGPVYLLLSMVKRKRVAEFRTIVDELAPRAVFTVEEVRSSQGGVMDVIRKGK